ncbi:MAG: sodium/solute symporter [Planctomycetes bacterium]|nr:sodium/solute symporter [Planctomycetota bacterium]
MAGLHVVDWIVLVGYLAAMVGVGAMFYKGQKSTKDFFLAGRSMSWLPVGISVVATLFSAISYMAIPSAIQKYGLIMLAGAVMVFACVPIVNRVFMPFYNRMGLYSAYEYLELRFDVRVRCLASGMFIFWRIVWMSVAVYAPSLALWAATGGQIPLIPTIIVLGLFATFYTVLGGMKAVIWTDVIQFTVLFGGMVLAAVLIVFKVDGGLAGIFHEMHAAGKTALVGSVPEMAQVSGLFAKLRAYFFCGNERVTLLGVLVASFVGHIAFYTVDQVVVQRYFSTKSLRDATQSFWLNAIANICLQIGLAFLGMSLFAYFLAHPHPGTIQGLSFKPDWKYPYFIATAMPTGVAGLLIAALYAATMSSVDSGINSCTTAYMVDFWRRLKFGQVHVPKESEQGSEAEHDLRMARILTLVIGAAVTFLACFVGRLGDIIVIAGKIVNSFCGPMLAIFLLGMFTRRARSLAVCLGAFVSLVAMAYLSFWTDLNFQWPSTFGLVIALALGYGISLIEKAPDPEKLKWTFAEQRKLWKADEQEKKENRP